MSIEVATYPLAQSSEFTTLMAPQHIEGYPTLSSGPCLAHRLPADVTQALTCLGEILEDQFTKTRKKAATAVLMRDPMHIRPLDEVADSLTSEILSLHQAKPQDYGLRYYQLRASVQTIVSHLNSVGELLEAQGYRSLYINAITNGFADHLHAHRYQSYLLYVKRQFGTALYDAQQRIAHKVRLLSTVGTTTENYSAGIPVEPKVVSSPTEGLLLPENVLHRSVRATDQDLYRSKLTIGLLGIA